MNALPRLLLRWTAITIFVALGLGGLFIAGHVGYDTLLVHGWGWGLFISGLLLPVPALPLTLGYFTYRRQYGAVVRVVTGFAAFVVFGLLTDLLNALGLNPGLRDPDFIIRHALLSLALFPLHLCAPILGAVWFYRLCIRLFDRAMLSKARERADLPPPPLVSGS